jgi:hypothetical protein
VVELLEADRAWPPVGVAAPHDLRAAIVAAVRTAAGPGAFALGPPAG